MTSCTSGIVSCVISVIPRVFPPRLESSWTTSLTPNKEADNSADFGAIHRNSCSVDWMIGIAVVIISLTVLSILNVPASSVGLNSCCYASSLSSRFRTSISRSSLSRFFTADSRVVSRSIAA